MAEAPEGVAIIGMSGSFPGAADLEAFWRNLRAGVESLSAPSEEELAASVPAALRRDPRYVRARGVLQRAQRVERFDAAFFGMSSREAESTDPQHRLLLEHAWEALERAGCDPARFPGSIGVWVGCGPDGYLAHHLTQHRKAGEPLDDLALLLGNDRDFLATRLAYKLNLRGPCVTVATACSTSLVAVVLAWQALLDYQCDLALAGGASIAFPLGAGYLYQEGHILSPDGRCRSFDARAQGTVPGDGAGVVALKRLSDALESGDPIHAVLLAGAVNNDGSLKVGFTAPSVEGQAEVISMAHALAGVDPRSIGYIEAHGTGTPLGDPIEIAALTQAFRAGTGDRGFCAVGSLKTNVGHLNAAAGVAGLIKAALTVERGEIPPSLHYETPNPAIDFASTPFFVNDRLRPWPRREGAPRRAGVSAFGFGGTNAHVLLEEAPAPPPPAPAPAWQLLVLSARTPAALDQAAERLAGDLERRAPEDLADVAWTLQVGRRAFPLRRCVAARDPREAAAALRATRGDRAPGLTGDAAPGVAFLFPGQGAQQPGMGAALYRAREVFRREIDRCLELAGPALAPALRAIFDPAGGAIDPALLADTAVLQPALFALEHALARLWMSWGVRPSALLGHSVGEYAAACVAGVFSLEDAFALVAARGRLMAALPPGAMLAAPLSEAELRPLLGARLSLAAINGPASTVASGPADAIEELERALASRGVSGQRLSTSHAFHSAMMDPILPELERLARAASPKAPSIPLLSNLSGAWMSAAEATDPATWARHARAPVRFADDLRELTRAGRPLLLEVGPGRTLSALAARLGGDAPRAIWSMPPRAAGGQRAGEDETLLAALGELWIEGVEIDWSALHGAGRRRVPLPTYPFQRERYWVDAPGAPDAGEAEDLAAVEARLQRELAVRPIEDDPALARDLDALCASYVIRYLRSGGVDLRAGAAHRAADLERALGVQPKLRRLFGAMLRMLVEDGLATREGDTLTFTERAGALPPPEDPARRIEARDQGLAELLRFLAHCAERWPDALGGRVEAISVLYPGGSPELTQAVDRSLAERRAARLYVRLLAEAVGRAADPARPLRILEVGGGQGALTWELAPALAGRCAEYCFTDLGRSFVEDARREAARRGVDSFMTFGVLDIGADPGPQGFAGRRFDHVLAYNVVHATRDLPATLRHLRGLLAPGGTLGLVEVVQTPRWDTLTWGLAEGFWYFSDRIREDSPLLPLDRWQRLLEDEGFSDVEAFPRDPAQRVRLDHGLLLARVPAAATVTASASASASAPGSASASAPATASASASARRYPRPDLRAPYVAPRDALEQRIAEICQDILGVERIGAHDDFLDLGADSLIMLRITDRLRQTLGREVPPHAAFRGATVERMAQALRGTAAAEPASPLIPLQPRGSRPPLFFVHPAAGVVFPYVELSRALGEDQPFYGLQALGLDGETEPDTTVEAMARHYIEAIRAVQPRGPYHIGGFSFGCLVAFEMARQLAGAGERIALVALVDEPAPVDGYRPSAGIMAKLLATGVAKTIWPHLHDYFYLRRASREAAAPAAAGDQRLAGIESVRPDAALLESFLARSTMANFVPRESRLLALRQPAMVPMFRLFLIHLRQTLEYTPSAYPHAVTLFRATRFRGKRGRDLTMGWRTLAAGGVEVHDIPGEHLTLIRHPHVEVLARKLSACLDEARRREEARAVTEGGLSPRA